MTLLYTKRKYHPEMESPKEETVRKSHCSGSELLENQSVGI